MTVTPKKHSAQPASSSYYNTSSRSGPAQMDEVEGLRLKLPSEDSVPLSSALAEPINLEDSHYVWLQSELEEDSRGLEAESWSTVVDQNYKKGLNKEDAKRQDVIYELMQTEMHHVRTLKILLCVYMHELRKSQLIEEAKLERLFPGVEALLSLHQHFLNCLKERLRQCQEEGSPNYQITKLGDILISQFSDILGESMMQSYSLFCSHHNDAISFYKELLQSSKKFHILNKQKIGQLPLVRRLGIPECFMLVTQRITKYPILVERIIENTEAETGEYQSLIQGLALIKDTITKVNDQVSEYEKVARLSQRLEPKSLGRLKDGQLLRREDLIQVNRSLLHEGSVSWKSSGRQKDVHAVLLSDMLLLLQEKDQKLVFAAVDNKPPVIPLQRLIVREVAHEDKAMFLISAYISEPEMYEIHTSSREECITWMTFIRGAVNCVPEDDGYHDLITKLHQYQDILKVRDEQIKQSLTEKQQIFAALYETVMEQEAPHKGLLLRGVPTDLHQGETLLNKAIEEMENLQILLFLRINHPNLMDKSDMEEGLLKQAETFVGADSDSSANTMKDRPCSSELSPEYVSHTTRDPQPPEIDYSESLEQSADDTFPTPTCHPSSNHFPGVEVCDSVMNLVQWLYSLKAVIAQQDSQIELHRALQSKTQLPSRHYSNVLLEQEKQRNLEKQRVELAHLHKLQAQHQEEQQRWETEREEQRVQLEALEAQLQQRLSDCKKWEEKLVEEKAELERQKDAHQQSLESLRDAVKAVEKKEERLNQESERLHKAQEKIYTKYMSMRNTGHSRYDDPTQFSTISSVVNRSGSSVFALKPQPTSNTTSDITEIPPKVPPRKESILNQLTKSERHVRPISTKNQVQNHSDVQQQIPAKLAAPPKGKDKVLKTKKSHQRTHSAASIDVNQVLPIRVTGKEGGSLRSTRNPSPQRIYQSDIFVPPGSVQSMKTSQSFSTHKRNISSSGNISSSDSSPPVPPPFPQDVLKTGKEKVIFL